MNKKENDQLKKIDQLHQQLDNTISKIGPTKVSPIKISKKKLILFILIPFSIACVISAVTSFLLIDPFHWYTKPRSDLELQQEKEIKQINQQFKDLNLASSLDSFNTIADLLFEIRNYSKINDIVKKLNETNEIKSITSKKDNSFKLSSTGEEVNIKINVRTGSLEKEIDVKLLVIVGNHTVKQLNELVKYPNFLNKITEKIKADGENKVSNLINAIKTIINEDDAYRIVFNNIKFDIVKYKDDNDEVIASGHKTLNLSFSFKENDKLLTSSVELNFDLQGKTREEINQYLKDKKIKQINELVKSKIFTDDIESKIEANGVNRVSDLFDGIKAAISENDSYRRVFKDITFYITTVDDKNDIIFSGHQKLTVHFSFTVNNESIESSVELNVELRGKTTEKINQIIIQNTDHWIEKLEDLVNSKTFTDDIGAKIKADGKNRVSDLINAIRTIFIENDSYSKIFKNFNIVRFDIVSNGVDNDEIIASGHMTLTLRYVFRQINNLHATSGFSFEFDLQS